MRDFAWRRIREKDLSLRIEIFGSVPITLVSLALTSLSFAGLVVLARSLNPIPSRTRPLNSSAPMVLSLKTWESRSLPGLPRTVCLFTMIMEYRIAAVSGRHFYFTEAVVSQDRSPHVRTFESATRGAEAAAGHPAGRAVAFGRRPRRGGENLSLDPRFDSCAIRRAA